MDLTALVWVSYSKSNLDSDSRSYFDSESEDDDFAGIALISFKPLKSFFDSLDDGDDSLSWFMAKGHKVIHPEYFDSDTDYLLREEQDDSLNYGGIFLVPTWICSNEISIFRWVA